jgi:hypothetical protein
MDGIELPAGPWDSEPDKIQWVDVDTNLDCLMVRNRFATWCGYVGVPRRHPLHGIDYKMVNVDVHGGLSLSERCAPGEPVDGICHIAEPGREVEPWWFGFDCGHYCDLQPGRLALGMALPGENYHYRTEEYVRSEVERLAQQLFDCRQRPSV